MIGLLSDEARSGEYLVEPQPVPIFFMSRSSTGQSLCLGLTNAKDKLDFRCLSYPRIELILGFIIILWLSSSTPRIHVDDSVRKVYLMFCATYAVEQNDLKQALVDCRISTLQKH